MQVRTLVSVMDGSGNIPPGSIRDFDDKEALRLIKLKAAVRLPLDINPVTGSPQTGTDPLVVKELEQIDGMAPDLVASLVTAGYSSLDLIAEAVAKDVSAIKGINKKMANKMIKSAQKIIDMAKIVDGLCVIDGLSKDFAEALADEGCYLPSDVVNLGVSGLMEYEGVSEEQATAIVLSATNLVTTNQIKE